MKTGIIIYLVGDIPDDWNEDVVEIAKKLGIHTDAVEIVSSKPDGYDVHYAWWRLLTQGIQEVVCKLVLFDAPDNLSFTGKELRLCG